MDQPEPLCTSWGDMNGRIEGIEDGDFANILKVLQDKSSPFIKEFETELDTSELTPEITDTLIAKMMCVGCQMLPKVGDRYLCPKGHLICLGCGGETPPADLEQSEESTEAQASSKDARGRLLRCPVDSCEEIPKLTPCDPVYAALFNHTLIKCPLGSDIKCEEEITGFELNFHMQSCVKKLMSKHGITLDNA